MLHQYFKMTHSFFLLLKIDDVQYPCPGSELLTFTHSILKYSVVTFDMRQMVQFPLPILTPDY